MVFDESALQRHKKTYLAFFNVRILIVMFEKKDLMLNYYIYFYRLQGGAAGKGLLGSFNCYAIYIHERIQFFFGSFSSFLIRRFTLYCR